MGAFHTSDMLARDGKTILNDKPEEFGQEWQVRPSDPKLFETTRFPQYPETCVPPDPTKKEGRRRLGETVSKKEAEKACAAYHTEQDMRDMCVFDVMASGDIEAAAAGAY